MNKTILEKRTLDFSIKLIETLGKLKKDSHTGKIIDQCIRSGTSIGANYREANGAESRKDFTHKLSLSFKEARETKYWLSILLSLYQNNCDLEALQNESDEFARIMGKSVSTCRQNQASKS